MDKYNIITPTDNLNDLTNDMVNWYQMPKKFRDAANDDCMRIYNCYVPQLYNRIKEKILQNMDYADIDDDNILSKGYIDLMSEDGTLYRCRATSEHHLILQEVEPDIILATDDKKYRISVNIEGQLYVQEVESDYYKNIYIIPKKVSYIFHNQLMNRDM